MTDRHKKALWLSFFGIFLLFCGWVGWYIGRPMIALAGEPELFREWVDGHGIWGRIIYVGMVVLQVIVAMIPGEPLELLGGYAFGTIEGTLLALLGIVIGSALVFGLVRKFGVRLVETFYTGDRIREFEFLKNPKKTRVIAFLLMMIPGTPKDFLSYFAGLTSLTLRQWLTIVTVARLPSVVTSTVSGGAAGAANYLLAAIMMGITVVLSLAGIWYYRLICREQKHEDEQMAGKKP